MISECNYGPKINNAHKNTKLDISMDYAMNDPDVCLELQTAQNLFSGIESNGSSYKYTIDRPIDDITIRNEYFGLQDSLNIFDQSYVLLFAIIIILFCLSYGQSASMKSNQS